MNQDFCFILALLILMSAPLIGVLAGLKRNQRKSEHTRHWSRTLGVIEESAVEDESAERGYLTYIRYAYAVNGHTFHHDEVWLNSRHVAATYDQAALLAERYFAGRRVTVFFDPRKPERAVLEPGFHAGAYLEAYRSVWMFLMLPVFVLTLLLFLWLIQFMK